MVTKTLPVKPGIDGLPTSTIPTDPAAFIDWFKNSYLPRWAANADIRNATAGAGVQISGDPQTPGFVGFEDITGTSVLGNPTGAAGEVQAITAGADGQFLGRIGGTLKFGSVSVVGADSIAGVGTPASPLELVNDAASPGASQYYGTDASGVKGYHTISSSAPVYPAGISLDLIFWWRADLANVSVNKRLPQLYNSNPNTPGYHAQAVVQGGTGTATTLNGKPILAFPGPTTASAYAFGSATTGNPAAAMSLGATGCTIFFVGSCTNFGATNGIIGGTSAPSLEFSISTGKNLILVNSGTAILATSTAVLTISTFFQCNVTYDAATGNIAFRVSQIAAGTATGTTHPMTLGSIAVGAESVAGAGPLIGFGAEIIVYQRVLAAGEITAIETELFSRWGV